MVHVHTEGQVPTSSVMYDRTVLWYLGRPYADHRVLDFA